MERIFEYVTEPEYDGKNIMTVLKQHYKMSSKLIKTLRSYDDGIYLNGCHARTVDIAHTGDVLRVTLKDDASKNIIPVNIPLDIVFEDEDILVINKQPFLAVHPYMGNYENSVANGVMYYFFSKGENRVFRAVNRLDKDTSGLMTIAKNAYIHARLSEEIKNGELKRKYICIVCGDIEKDGIVNAPIKREQKSVINRVVAKNGQDALTHYKVIKRFGDYTLLEMKLETGRTHQIRVHMAYIGHPLLGDWLYGEENHALVKRQMLHSCFLRFVHPITGKVFEFKTDIPQDMSDFITKIQRKQ